MINRRVALFGIPFSAGIPALFHTYTQKEFGEVQVGDLIGVIRSPNGYHNCGTLIVRYQVQADGHLKSIGLDGRMEGADKSLAAGGIQRG